MILAVVAIILIIAGFKFPSSKKVTIALLLFMWVLYGFNDANGDYLNYYYDYAKILRGDFYSFSFSEEGYIIIAYICGNFLKMNYQDFLVFTSFFSTLALGYAAQKFSPQPNTALSLFILNPYWIMICQTRFYAAFLFALIGYSLLAEYDSKKGVIYFLVFTFISGFFHRVGWLFSILILSKIKSKKILYASLVLSSLIIFLFRTPAGMKIAERYIGEKKVAVWLAVDAHRSMLGVFLIVCIHFLIMAAAIFLYQETSKRKETDTKALYLLNGIILMMAFLPMECIDKNYERFFRFSLLSVYLLYGHYKEGLQARFRSIPVGIIMVFGCLSAYYIFFYFSFSGWFEHNLFPILKNNILIR